MVQYLCESCILLDSIKRSARDDVMRFRPSSVYVLKVDDKPLGYTYSPVVPYHTEPRGEYDLA